MNWRNRRRSRRQLKAVTSAVATVAMTVGFGAVDADAGQITRPIRDTSSRTVTSTGKVLLAIPRHGHGRHYLHAATRDYHGRPVRCGVGYGEPHRLVIGRLPTWDRYNAAYNVCEPPSPRPAFQTFRPEGASRNTSASGSAASAGPVVATGDFTVIAAGPTRFEDLDASLKADPWALMDAGRYRDARRVFGQQLGSDNSVGTRAGLAVAAALSGDLKGGAQALGDLAGSADALRGVGLSPSMSAKLMTLADTLYANMPDVQNVLRAMAGGQPNDA